MLISGERHLRLVLAEYEAHYNGRRPHRSRQLRPPRPDRPVADLSQKRMKRRPVPGGSSTNTSEPHRSPGQDRWPSSGTPQGVSSARTDHPGVGRRARSLRHHRPLVLTHHPEVRVGGSCRTEDEDARDQPRQRPLPELAEIVSDAALTDHLASETARMLGGGDGAATAEVAEQVLALTTRGRERYEADAYALLADAGLLCGGSRDLQREIEYLHELTRPYLVGSTLLDFGCGDGKHGTPVHRGRPLPSP